MGDLCVVNLKFSTSLMSFQEEQYRKVTNTYLAGSVSSLCIVFCVTVDVKAQKTTSTFKYHIGEEQSKTLTDNYVWFDLLQQ